ncbi:MAG: site-specific integrase, partial [Candidatus Nanopelagicales bacterium]
LQRSVWVERAQRQDGSVGPTKSSRSKRSVPLGEVVLNVLSAHLAGYPTDEWLFGDEHGRPLSYQRWKRLWGDARGGSGSMP